MLVRFPTWEVEYTTDSDADEDAVKPIYRDAYEHCVAEGGWHHPNGFGQPDEYLTLWECPCEECKPWIRVWKHLFAEMWGAKMLVRDMGIDYKAISERKLEALGVYDYLETGGIKWECLQWEEGLGSPTEPSENEAEDGEGEEDIESKEGEMA